MTDDRMIRVLTQLWKNVLKVPVIGTDHNFFEIGGHSLMATQVISRVREQFRVELAMRVLFERPTVSALADAIDAIAWVASSRHQPAVAGDRVEIEL